MFSETYTYLSQLVESNQFLSGGILLGAAGLFLNYVKQVPPKIWEVIKRRFIVSIYCRNSDQTYRWISYWLYINIDKNNYRKFSVSSYYGDNGVKYYLKADVGSYLFFLKKKLTWIIIDRREKENSSDHAEDIKIQILFGKENDIVSILEEAKDTFFKEFEPSVINEDATFQIYAPSLQEANWELVSKRLPRKLEHLAFSEDIYSIKNDLEVFLKSSDKYLQKGIPYKRNYILYGPPGNGKTSLLMALASELHLKLCKIDISKINGSLTPFKYYVQALPPNSMLVMEDVDVLFDKDDQRELKGGHMDYGQLTSFSELLNILDGIDTPDGLISFITTNHVEKLDSALIRPGRMDKMVKVDNGTYKQVVKIFEKFLENTLQDDQIQIIKKYYKDYSLFMAEIQEICNLSEDNSFDIYFEKLKNRLEVINNGI